VNRPCGSRSGAGHGWSRRVVAPIVTFSLTLFGLVAVVPAASAATVTPPDMQLEVPTNAISIGTVGGVRQLRFTHITWDAGTGPFEIDPSFNAQTGTATFQQAIYNSSSPGVWSLDHRVPVVVTGVFDPPSDYQFPLAGFTLNAVNTDGTPGAVVATSPKLDYCITADAFVGGVPNTPNQTYIPQSNCTNPTLPLGWSVGWGDQYDQTDSGQPISLAGVPDGQYVLRGIVDPQHVLTESNPSNNEVDTTLTISGNTVTVVSQRQPGNTPPSVTVTSPTNGASVSGTVTLSATAAATPPATVTSVQYLLDGLPLGSPVTAAPYSFAWTVGSTVPGPHTLSARVTDSNGSTSTAPLVSVTAVSSGGFGIDRSINATGTGKVTTGPLSTSLAGDVLIAFVGSDGPSGAGQQSVTLSGGGLTWSLVTRANARSGDAEIWTAPAPSLLTNVAISSTPTKGGFDQSLSVVAFEGAAGVGASAIAGAASGSPTVGLTATSAGSLTFAAGNDWDTATARTLGPNQNLVSQWVDARTGDTYWTQTTAAQTTAAGQNVVLNDTAPALDQWNLAAVEIVPAGQTPPPPDTTPPTVGITNPTNGQTVSATIPVAANAMDNVAVASVQFFLDGRALGNPVTAAPYAVTWSTTTATNGTHLLSATASDPSGNVGTAVAVTVTVQNPVQPPPCFVMQVNVSVHGNSTVTTPAFHTAAAGEVLLAFVATDGPASAGKQTTTVSGAGLTWTLVKRQNASLGDSEVWMSSAASVLSNATVKSTQSKTGYAQDLTVIAMEGVSGVGASIAASGASGAPSLNLTTAGAGSLVFAVGNDWANGQARVLPAGWVLLDQWVNTSVGDTYWTQYTNSPTGAAGSVVSVKDTAPTTDPWNLVAVELLAESS
jgi:hypothetical protein